MGGIERMEVDKGQFLRFREGKKADGKNLLSEIKKALNKSTYYSTKGIALINRVSEGVKRYIVKLKGSKNYDVTGVSIGKEKKNAICVYVKHINIGDKAIDNKIKDLRSKVKLSMPGFVTEISDRLFAKGKSVSLGFHVILTPMADLK